jgi:hypothetical protein
LHACILSEDNSGIPLHPFAGFNLLIMGAFLYQALLGWTARMVIEPHFCLLSLLCWLALSL